MNIFQLTKNGLKEKLFKSIPGYVFAEIIQAEKVLPSGLILADNVKDRPHRAKVISVGGPYLDHKGRIKDMCCKDSDIIHFRKPNGKYITYQGKKYVKLHNENILAVEQERS